MICEMSLPHSQQSLRSSECNTHLVTIPKRIQAAASGRSKSACDIPTWLCAPGIAMLLRQSSLRKIRHKFQRQIYTDYTDRRLTARTESLVFLSVKICVHLWPVRYY